MMLKHLRAAAVMAMLALPAQSQTLDPQTLLNDVDRILDDGGALALDTTLTEAVQRARNAGPLQGQWAQVMVVNANLIMGGLCRYERAMMLYADAIALAEAQDEPALRDLALSFRAYFNARMGRPDWARADLALMQGDPAAYLDAEYATELTTLLAAAVSVANSPGFNICTVLARDAARLFSDGDLEQARSLLLGLRLPEVLAADPLVRLMNVSNDGLLALVEDRLGRDGIGPAFDRITADLSVPGSDPPKLRPELLTDPFYTSIVADALEMITRTELLGGGEATRRATALRWLSEIADQDPGATARRLTEEVSQARIQGDWAGALSSLRAHLALPGIGDDMAITLRSEEAELQAFLDIDAGRDIDADAMATAFRDLISAQEIIATVRLQGAGNLVRAFDIGGEGYLAYLAGVETWVLMRQLQRDTAQSGQSVAGQGRRLREVADIAIKRAFDVAAQPPDGAEPPPGLCQEVIELELCTIVLERP